MTAQTQEPNPQNDLLCASIILQGLLASGHFTKAKDDEYYGVPEIKQYDNGDEWKKNNALRRYKSWAALMATELLEELKEHLKPQEVS